MNVMLGILLNTIIVAAMIVWLSRGGGAAWINTLNATSLSTCISLFIIMETSGAVLGMFIWAMVNGKHEYFAETLGYLGIWFAFLGTHVLADRATNIGKRLTDGTYTEKKGEAAAKLEAAKAPTPATVNVAAQDQSTVAVSTDAPTTAERAAIPAKPKTEPDLYADDERGD